MLLSNSWMLAIALQAATKGRIREYFLTRPASKNGPLTEHFANESFRVPRNDHFGAHNDLSPHETRNDLKHIVAVLTPELAPECQP
jgi:hypothetical protein